MKLRTVIGACTLIAAVPLTTQAELNSDGNWSVERGDTLYNIARRVAPGNGKEQARIREYMFNESPSAFKNNNPGSLEVGKTLYLPGATVVTSKPEPAPKAKPVVKPAVVAPILSTPKVATPAPVVSTPAPKVASPAVKPDSFKARIEAKRLAKEAADKKRAEAARLAAEQTAKQQKEAAAALQAKQQAAQQAAALQAQQRAAAAMAAKKKADARRKAAAAAKKLAAAKPKPAPRVTQVNKTVNSANPYVECKTTNPDEKCGNWNINYRSK